MTASSAIRDLALPHARITIELEFYYNAVLEGDEFDGIPPRVEQCVEFSGYLPNVKMSDVNEIVTRLQDARAEAGVQYLDKAKVEMALPGMMRWY